MNESWRNDAQDGWEADTSPGIRADAYTRVLVVDDDHEMRELVRARLVRDGFEVSEAKSGEGLLHMLHALELDSWPHRGVELVIVDLKMPGMSGLEALRRLREEKWDTPALLMTAFPDPEVKKSANELGVPLLAKPFGLDDLSRAVSNLLILDRLREDGSPREAGA